MYGNLTPEAVMQTVEEAAKEFDVVQSNNTTLLLDIDTLPALAQFERVLPKVKENFGVANVERWTSKSGNAHIKIILSEPFPVTVRLALQAALGSDGVRELLSLKRLMNGCDEPSYLFKPKGD